MLLRKCEVLRYILDSGVIAVIRADHPEKALQMADAVHDGGINAIEITMTVPDAIEVIRELNKHYSKGEVVLGAGTVLDDQRFSAYSHRQEKLRLTTKRSRRFKH